MILLRNTQRKIMNLIRLSTFLLVSIGVLFNQHVKAEDPGTTGIEFESGNWQSIVDKAKKENKIIFLDAYASWCGPCKRMSADIFTDKQVADYYNSNFINAKIDMEIGEGIELASLFEVQAYPTLLYVDANSNMVHRVCGYREVDNFIEEGRNAKTEGKRLKDIIASFDGAKASAEEMNAMLVTYRNACMDNSSAIEQYFSEKNATQCMEDKNWQLIMNHVNDPTSTAIKTINSNYPEFVSAFGKEEVDNKLMLTYQSGFNRTLRTHDETKIAAIRESSTGLNDDIRDRVQLYMNFENARFEKNYDVYASNLIEYLNKYPTKDARMLNKYAWSFYENVDKKEYLDKAIKWAETSVEVDPGYYNYDTLAAVHFKAGNKQQALSACNKAIELAQKSKEDYSETSELKNKIMNMP